MQLLNPREVPLEGRYGIGRFEVVDSQRVASTLIAGERGLRACDRRSCEEFLVSMSASVMPCAVSGSLK